MAFVALDRAPCRRHAAEQSREAAWSTSNFMSAIPKNISMNNNIVRVSLLSLILSLPACIDEAGEDELTARAESALNGGPWIWKNAATQRCLDSDAIGSAYTLPCNNGSYQLWTNTPLTFGDRIRDLATGWCLDSGGLDSEGRGHAYTLPCNGGSYQQWTVTNRGALGFEIRNVATQWCLDSNTSGSVYTLPCNNGTFQRWW
jgi:hypothetical protein